MMYGSVPSGEDYQAFATAAECKAQGRVLYNGGCQNRGNSCCGGKGYLAQVPANNGWGQCLTYRTLKPCTGSTPAPKVVNPPTGTNCTPSNCFAKPQKDPGPGGCTHQIVCWQSPRPGGSMSCIEGGSRDIHGCPNDIRVNCDTCNRARSKWLSENKGGGGGSSGGGGGSGSGGVDADCDNYPLGKGLCVLGKSFTKGITGVGEAAGGWAQNPLTQFMPIMLIGGGIMLLAIMAKGR